MRIDLFGNVIAEEIEQEVKVKKPSPFDFIGHIAKKTRPESLEHYNPYITNLGYSQHKDTIFYANEMNKYHALAPEAQFDFYYSSLPKKNYFGKWSKAADEKDLPCVMCYYNVSKKVAREYLRALSEPQLEKIRTWFENKEGGKTSK